MISEEDRYLRYSRNKVFFKEALTEKINNRIVYMKGIDASYRYEGYNLYKAEDLRKD